MKSKLIRIAATASAAFLPVFASGDGFANSITTGYDIKRLLMEGHPLAGRMGTKWQPADPAAPTAIQPTAQPVYQPAPTVQPRAQAVKEAPAGKPAGYTNTAESRSGGWDEKEARASSRGTPMGGFLAEVSLGTLMHDEGPFSNSKEDGIDAHIEIKFKSPEFLSVIWSPEPHIGANINTKGGTSQVFAGLSYEWNVWKGLFAGISVGGAYHNGETDSHLADAKDLGCHLLFRESLTLGWQLTEHHKVALLFDHISNAKICDFNEGLENLGVRYSYRF
ncbi:MAG: acyloxyacyl hydrolase [Rhodospirillaceae bacterium]